jgi:hypothetical protein
MGDSWVRDEFLSADLGDERLNRRLMTISERFAQSPVSPINQACDDWTETKAAYRFFRNDNVAYRDITKGHCIATKERCREYPTVLAIQDTTYFNYSQHPQTQGLCPLSRNKGKHRADIVTLGLIMHSTFVVNTEGLPLGIADQKIYSRPRPAEPVDPTPKRYRNAKLPIEKKDSYRWLESLENTCANLSDIQGRVVTICDREADMYDLFFCATQLNAPLVVRANYDRAVNKRARYSEITGEKLWPLLQSKKCAARIQVQIPKQEGHEARIASCEVKFSNFVMNVPINYCEGRLKKPVDLNLHAVHVAELNCPEKHEPIDWMLITNIPIENREEALEKVGWYCLRWRIETWHKVLKSGLQVEECRLSTAARLTRYLAVMSVVAWRIFWITLIARVAPQASSYMFLNELEWKILAAKFHKLAKSDKNQSTPTLEQSVRWIAQLGGFLARKGDKQPGIMHVWRGMKKLAAMIEGAQLVREIYG